MKITLPQTVLFNNRSYDSAKAYKQDQALREKHRDVANQVHKFLNRTHDTLAAVSTWDQTDWDQASHKKGLVVLVDVNAAGPKVSLDNSVGITSAEQSMKKNGDIISSDIEYNVGPHLMEYHQLTFQSKAQRTEYVDTNKTTGSVTKLIFDDKKGTFTFQIDE